MDHSLPRNRLALAVLVVGSIAGLGADRASPGTRSLPAIRSRADFDALARVTDTPYPLPHLLFVIDRQDHNRVYYVNSKRYLFHAISSTAPTCRSSAGRSSSPITS